MNHKVHLVLLILLIEIPALCAQSVRTLDSSALFISGTSDYDTYRIPALVTTGKGTLLAFCEGRKDDGGDAGNIDILLRRSEDNGKTWSEQVVIWDDGSNTCGNPCPVVDEQTGDIHLLLTHNLGDDHETDIIHKKSESTRTVWAMKSSDDGKSWSAPKEITPTTKKKEWGWYATGPGIGIQVKHGPCKGRLIIPSDHSYDDPGGKVRNGPFEYGSHVIYSDDHGDTWKLGGTIRPKVNECQVVELADGNGTLLMNMRSYFGKNKRTHAISYDGGLSWTAPYTVDELVEPVCQASILRYRWPGGEQPGILLFLNPATSGGRRNMSLRMSLDEGKTWPFIRTVFPGPSAYSSMTVLKNNTVALLYEGGTANPYEQIIFHTLKIGTDD
ncbi:sialidase family protein [Sinomicrobium soli]|uniref:sialidase family protein n=1 Tax=Sinomicrobium sp. N-1-3-6 TaxID=2219864 RepID=UPI000DCE81D8|nr:sialidase family protein [Sinomicrobium sp. N-1-3-6]RAV29541.1 exo-alpha-sialidase [Sinomicrobium sp. N-1-3-6]